MKGSLLMLCTTGLSQAPGAPAEASRQLRHVRAAEHRLARFGAKALGSVLGI